MEPEVHPPWDPFRRTRIREGLIQSTCMSCGFYVVGTIESVLAVEVKHFTYCRARTAKTEGNGKSAGGRT